MLHTHIVSGSDIIQAVQCPSAVVVMGACAAFHFTSGASAVTNVIHGWSTISVVSNLLIVWRTIVH
jgi:hypothetical protein